VQTARWSGIVSGASGASRASRASPQRVGGDGFRGCAKGDGLPGTRPHHAHVHSRTFRTVRWNPHHSVVATSSPINGIRSLLASCLQLVSGQSGLEPSKMFSGPAGGKLWCARTSEHLHIWGKRKRGMTTHQPIIILRNGKSLFWATGPALVLCSLLHLRTSTEVENQCIGCSYSIILM
jgi:hypothetical protein